MASSPWAKAAEVISFGLYKAKSEPDPPKLLEPPAGSEAATDPKALFFDPWEVQQQMGFRDKPTQVTYETIQSLIWKIPILAGIIQTRVDEVANFAQIQTDKYKLGYKVKMRDPKAEPTEQDVINCQTIERMIQNTGWSENRSRDSFESFVRKIMFDSLAYDACCFEIIPGKNGKPSEFYAVDAATIRLAESASAYLKANLDQEVRYVQIHDREVVAEFSDKELAYGIRNPRTTLRLAGYGVSEIEMALNALSSYLLAFSTNQNLFSQGSIQAGMLVVKSPMSEKQMSQLRRHWYQQVADSSNAWRTPIIQSSEGVDWHNIRPPMDQTFENWMAFLIKQICGAFRMDPAAVNYVYGNTGQSTSIGGQQSSLEKIQESRERGLRPILRFLEDTLNKHIVYPMDERYRLVFEGMDSMSLERTVAVQQKQVSTYLTIDEARANEDLAPLPDGKGQIILNPAYTQLQQAEMQTGESQDDKTDWNTAESEMDKSEQPVKFTLEI